MDTFKWLLPALLIWPAIKLVQLLSVVRVLRGLRIAEERIERLEVEAAPAWFIEAGKPLADELVAAGFAPRFVLVKRSVIAPCFDVYCLRFFQEGEPVVAGVYLHDAAGREGAAYVVLHTSMADGRHLVTASHQEITILPPAQGVESEILPGVRVSELVKRHRERVGTVIAAGGVPLVFDEQDSIAMERRLSSQTFARFQGSGLAEPAPSTHVHDASDACLRLRWPAAFSYARRLLRALPGEKKAAKAALAVAAPAQLSEASRTEFELRHYRQMTTLQDMRFSWLPKAVLMLVSLAFFALALGWNFNLELGLVLVAALIFHECGHLLGMKLFGYKDTQLLFLPFLGGVAVARDRLVLAPWKHLVILFLGPLPGIFVGVGLLIWSGAPGVSEFVHEAGLLVLLFNAFNLLPILPLDGGQIMDVALVSRFPRMRVVFLAGSGLGLIVVGYLASAVMLKVLGVFMLFRIMVEWKHAGIVRELRLEFTPAAEEELVLRRILAELRRKLAPGVGLVQRLPMVTGLLERVRRPRPGAGDIVLAAGGYAGTLVLALALAYAINLHRGERRIAEARARAEAAGLLESVAPARDVVADEENAATPLFELEEIFRRSRPGVEISDEERERCAVLLAQAASRSRFNPPANFSAEETGMVPVGLLSAFAFVGEEAAARLRYGRADEALPLIEHAFVCLGHLRQAPAIWSYEADREARRPLWRAIEEAMAENTPVTEAQLRVLAAAADENALVAHARLALRESHLASLRWRDSADMGEVSLGGMAMVFNFIQRLGTHYYSSRAEVYDNAIELDSALAAIEGGAWPLKLPGAAAAGRALDTGFVEPLGEDAAGDAEQSADASAEELDLEVADWSMVDWQLDILADDVAATRLIRAGLALRLMAERGRALPEEVAGIEAEWPLGPLTDPRSLEPMRMEKRGVFLVLSLERTVNVRHRFGESSEHSWRLPLKR